MDEKYYAIIQKVLNGEEPTAEEYKTFIEFLPKIDDSKLAELQAKSKLKNPDGSVLTLSPEETTQLFTLMSQKAMSSPSAKAAYLKQAENIAKSNIGNKITNVLNTAIATGDIIASTNQVKQARKLARQSRRPERAPALTRDPLLKQALFEAQQGNFDAAKRLAPAQQEILNNYLSDLNVAKTASTGQAGTYGALGQVASTRRARASQGLVPLADEVTRANQSRLDNLLQMRLGENQAIQQSQAANYPTDMLNYRAEQEAIGALGSQGRENLRQSAINFGQQLPETISSIATKRRFDRLRANLGAHPDVVPVAEKALTDNINSWNRPQPLLEEMLPPSTYNYVFGRR